MSNDQAIVLVDRSALTFSFAERANQLKEEALAKSALIGQVLTAAQQQVAVTAQAEIKGMLSLIEKARVAAKEPYLEMCRTIDFRAKEYIADLKAEELRIATELGSFQQLEDARIAAAERARQEEERLLRMQREAEEQRIRDEAAAAQKKLDDEAKKLAEKAAKARSDEARAKIEEQRLEVERQRALSTAETHDALDQVNAQHAEQVAALPTPERTVARGQTVKKDWVITVVDKYMLARHHPNCVSIEPLVSEIKSLLNAGTKVQGITATKETVSNARPARQARAIDV